jgi:Lon protease-like protein
MPSRLLPLFPLQVVVFPRTQLPLHIFEDRYKEMVGEAIQNKSEFGIVLAKDDGIVNAGCSVTVQEVVKQYPDGRMDILAVGRRRFEVVMLDEEKNYLRGQVEFFDDEDQMPVPEPLRIRALAEYKGLAEIGEIRGHETPNLSDPQLSFQLAQAIRDTDFLSLLLRSRSETQRLKELGDFLTQYVPRQKHVAQIRAVAPMNGFSAKHVNIE